MSNPVLDAIHNRRSIRKFTTEPVPEELIHELLEAGRWAPSGLNNQPWRFAVIRQREILERLSALTKYSHIIKAAGACIAVYFHKPSGYNRDKDLMGIGACIQNILLAAYASGIGAVWLGEILNRKDDVNVLLNIPSDHELTAVIALGWPDEDPGRERRPLSDLIITG